MLVDGRFSHMESEKTNEFFVSLEGRCSGIDTGRAGEIGNWNFGPGPEEKEEKKGRRSKKEEERKDPNKQSAKEINHLSEQTSPLDQVVHKKHRVGGGTPMYFNFNVSTNHHKAHPSASSQPRTGPNNHLSPLNFLATPEKCSNNRNKCGLTDPSQGLDQGWNS